MGFHVTLFTYTLLASVCLSQEWQDSYLKAYKQSEGAVFEGPYSHPPVRMPMQLPMRPMTPNMTVAMMPFILQVAMLIARIILKMTIFKIIVKFIAVVCLFLFIPTLRLPQMTKRSDDRAWSDSWEDVEKNTIDTLSIMVKNAIKKHKDKFS